MNNVISTIIKFVTTGADVAARGIAGVNKAAGVATRSMATLASSLGSMGGSLGKAAGQVANFMMSIQQMGAVGGIIAGAQKAITQISDHFIEKANKMKEAVEKMADRIRTKLEDINNAHLDGVRKSLDEANSRARQMDSIVCDFSSAVTESVTSRRFNCCSYLFSRADFTSFTTLDMDDESPRFPNRRGGVLAAPAKKRHPPHPDARRVGNVSGVPPRQAINGGLRDVVRASPPPQLKCEVEVEEWGGKIRWRK